MRKLYYLFELCVNCIICLDYPKLHYLKNNSLL